MLPERFERRMQALLGEEYGTLREALEGTRHRALRVNPLKGGGPRGSRERFLAQSLWNLEPVPWEENGFYYDSGEPGRHPYHEAGVYYIQEPSAMAPAVFLGARPGERVLDLCAAPGGKTTQIAGMMGGQGLLVSNEIHPQRAGILSENVERMGIRNALVLNEAPERLAEFFPDYFDRILVDAPCSGEGMLRKNENAAQEWSEENVERCARRQDGILDCAAAMLRPGGRLVYSTCTFAPEENEGSVDRLLKRYSEMEILDPAGCLALESLPPEWGFAPGRPDWIGEGVAELDRTLRLWPHRMRGEGHYLAVLRKGGRAVGQTADLGGARRGAAHQDCPEYLEFAAENLTALPEGVFLHFGGQLYLTPADMPSLRGLRVLRPGLHLGALKKNRFEPSHALALALSPGEARRLCPVSAGGQEQGDMPRAASYLSGLTFSYDGEKGWYLVTVGGYSLGWGKLASGVMKNHYPRGLRKM